MKNRIILCLIVLFLYFLICEIFFEILFSNVGKAIYVAVMATLYVFYVGDLIGRFINNRIFSTEIIFLCLIVIACLSDAVNGNKFGRGFQVAMFSLKFLPIYFLLISNKNINAIKFEAVFLVALLIPSFFCIIQFLNPDLNKEFIVLSHKFSNEYSLEFLESAGLTGSFASKNIFGTLMCIGFMLSYFRYLNSRHSQYLFLSCLYFSMVLLSSSKINIFVAILCVYQTSSISKKYIFRAVALLAVVFILSDNFQSQINTNLNIVKLIDADYYKVAQEHGRLNLLNVSTDIIINNPIFGVGAGNWGTGLSYRLGEEGVVFANYKGMDIQAGVLQDNFWISIATQFGLVFTIVFTILMVRIYASSDKSTGIKYIALAVMAGSLVYSIFEMKIICFTIVVLFAIRSYKLPVSIRGSRGANLPSDHVDQAARG